MGGEWQQAKRLFPNGRCGQCGQCGQFKESIELSLLSQFPRVKEEGAAQRFGKPIAKFSK